MKIISFYWSAVVASLLLPALSVALVPYQATHVAAPSRQLFYRNRHIEDDRYTATHTSDPRKTTTATRPAPLPDAEPKHQAQASSLKASLLSQFLSTRKGSSSSSAAPRNNGINLPMLKNLALSQATLLSLTTAMALTVTTLVGGSGVGFLDSLSWVQGPAIIGVDPAATSTFGRLALGAFAAVPMIYVSQRVDQAASRRDASHAHFATTNMVVNLFGRRNRPENREMQSSPAEDVQVVKAAETTSTMEVILSSLGLSFLTSICEEIVFRGYVPALILAITHSPIIAWLGQAVVFGLGHIHPLAQEGENRVVAATQTFNALFGYGLAYVLTGGDLWTCIAAHALYDLHVLVSSWHNVNSQIDWTEDAIQEKLSESDAAALQQLKQWAGPSLTADTLNLCRRFFYAFDEDHKHALSLPNVQRAMSYAFLSDPKQPSTTQVESLFEKVLEERQYPTLEAKENRIGLTEFVRVLFSLRAQTASVSTA